MVSERDQIVFAVTGVISGTFSVNDTARAGKFADELLQHKSLLMTPKTMALGNADAAAMANRLAGIWKADPGRMDRFAEQIRPYPALVSRFKALSPEAAMGVFERYNPQTAKDLGQNIDRAFLREHPQARRGNPQTQGANTGGAGATAGANGGGAGGSTGANRPTTGRTIAREERGEPQTARTTPTRGDAATTPATDATVATPTANGTLSPAGAAFALKTIVGQASAIFGAEFKPQEDALIERLKNPAFLRQVTDSMNSDPELVAQINGKAGGMGELLTKYNEQTPEIQESIRNAIKPYYQQLLEDPTKIGDKKWRDEMQSAATNQGMIAGVQNLLKGMGINIDIGGLFDGLKQFLGPLMDGIKNLMGGFSSGEFALQRSGGKDLYGAAQAAMQRTGMMQERSEYITRYAPQVADRTNDGKFSKDDAVTIRSINGTEHQVYQDRGGMPILGASDGTMRRTFVTEIDERGYPKDVKELVIKADGQPSWVNPDTQRPIAPVAQPQQPATTTAAGAQGSNAATLNLNNRQPTPPDAVSLGVTG